MATKMRAGIVGAGIAGASCAGALAAAGWEVDIFEKARGAGGRLSSRRMEEGWASLGSPFISAKRDPFRSQLRDWVRMGWLEAVRGNIMKGRATVSWTQAQLQNHYRPLIEPSQLVRNLMGTARLHTESRVARLAPRTIQLEGGAVHGDYDCVICSVPTPQAIPLLEGLPRLQERLQHDTRYRPVWSFIMRWEGGPPADVIQFDDELLNLAVRQADGEGVWAVHSTHAFAETYLDVSKEEASTRGASALMGLLALPWPVEVEAAHLWKMALPTGQHDGFWLGDRENRVALIGDGIAGAGVERAWESGTRLAQALVQAEAELSH
ncbi:MAG: NAD/FAD-dependent oxidoreductase [Hydrogenophilales bacterium 16-64-46]|nr:MAG: NAD/FAD-dependent oxidoreductase [Hydrogenophilales bacterium 12-64-13]OYZ04169.1 MAG: NAD/FAD-dependent oxidoreductase [Hydrogenophilales bacterium 16-64-46]OZA36914.1 MAG: NAD/FAD-dependent oxidoreductase [Hydrogenophilales bacterium 17-64-34]HQS99965.1 NAD(P)-binding protein [Thiobacillus sp.]